MRPRLADAGKGKPGSESETPHSGFYSSDKADGSSPGFRIQKTALANCFVLLFFYFIVGFLLPGHYGANNLFMFVVIYFITAYVKFYMPKFVINTKANLFILFVSFFGLLLLLILTNFLGLKISFFSDKMLYWDNMQNVAALLFALAAFNLIRKRRFQNSFINFASSTSLLVYLFHENLLFRTYSRPLMWQWIFQNTDSAYLPLSVLACSFLLFFLSFSAAVVYKISLQRLVHKVILSVYSPLSVWTNKVLEKIAKK